MERLSQEVESFPSCGIIKQGCCCRDSAQRFLTREGSSMCDLE